MSKSDFKGRNPDKGPPMIEGEHYYDKGYMSDDQYAGLGGEEVGQRGNTYLSLQNEIIRRDNKKTKRGKFTKIA